MQGMRIKTQVILGVILLLTAFTGIDIPVSSTSALSPLNLGAAMPAKAASILPQAEMPQEALPIIDCSTCHDPMMISPQVNTAENDQSILMQTHSESIIQCVSCHAETAEMNFNLMGEPD